MYRSRAAFFQSRSLYSRSRALLKHHNVKDSSASLFPATLSTSASNSSNASSTNGGGSSKRSASPAGSRSVGSVAMAKLGAEPFLTGTSSVYIEEMYRAWLEDSSSVHKVLITKFNMYTTYRYVHMSNVSIFRVGILFFEVYRLVLGQVWHIHRHLF